MENDIEYFVVPERGFTHAESDAVGIIKNGRWYEIGESGPGVRFDETGRAEVMAGCWARIEGLILIREEDGVRFLLIPSKS